jgi:hypothetical protein
MMAEVVVVVVVVVAAGGWCFQFVQWFLIVGSEENYFTYFFIQGYYK